MLTDTELIRKLDFFESLGPKTIQQIAQLCIAREFAIEEYIVRQGESGLGLYFITSGRAKVEIERDGMKVVVAELKEGDFLGELSIIDDKARSANVICLEETRCLLLTRDSFSKLLKKHPEIALQMLRSLVSRIRSTNERISGSRAAQAAAAAAAPGPPPPATPPRTSTSPLDGIGAATERITAVLPKPEDMVKMYSSTKDRVQNMMVGMFGTMYVVKAMTRFSMAMVGCPVTVRAEKRDPEVVETVIAGVKIVLFPAHSDQAIRIEAYADGELSATVLRPVKAGEDGEVEVVRWEGSVRRNEILELHVPAANATRPGPTETAPAPCRLVPHSADQREETIAEHRWAMTQARWRDGVQLVRWNATGRAAATS
ncbi:MAG: Crp/Fnr family transcriptional regulator [Terriglobia bacterium]